MPKPNFRTGCVLIGITAAVLFVWLVVWPVGRMLYVGHRHTTVRESAAFQIPNTGFELVHSRIGINALVAEYRRDITYSHEGVVGKTTPLSIDTCGGYPINCYLIQAQDGTFLRLDDAVSEHLLDLDRQVTYVVARHEGKAYIGELTSDSMSTGWSTLNDDPSTLKVTIGGKPATPIEEITGSAVEDMEEYIGCLAGGLDRLRFVPASESPEQPIQHLFP